jgi:DNA-directed RNA polymerase specialized sigma24 family protein
MSSSSTTTMASEWETAPGLPWQWGTNPDLWLYRDRTLALLYRFFKLSMEAGRLPSMLGQEFFRTQITSYNLSSFEDVVIFVHDIERCIGRLDPFSQDLIGRIVFQGFSQEETARLTGCSRRTVVRRYPEALDQLSEIFLKVGILLPFPVVSQRNREACQAPEETEMAVTM